MQTIEELKRMPIDAFPDARIYLFGSRARGDASEFSDIDIAIESERPLQRRLSEIRERIEASRLPWKVDLLEMRQAPGLRSVIEREGHGSDRPRTKVQFLHLAISNTSYPL
jgi:predicted nucleotidyltransferase